jgi:hypothetical protein
MKSSWRISTERREDSELSEVVISNATNPSERYVFPFAVIHGVPCIDWCPPSRYERISDGIKYRSTDMMVSTYPKCGTTWVEQVVLMLKAESFDLLDPVQKNAYNKATGFGKIWADTALFQDRASDDRQFQNMTWEEFDSAPAPRIFKSHLPIQLVLGTKGQGVAALPEGMKTVIVSRNPYDTCVSAYYFFAKPKGCPFEAYALAWLEGAVEYGNYFDWMKGWYEEYKKYPERILWIRYEDLKKDPFRETKRVAEFIDAKSDEPFIQQVVDLSSFDSMQHQAQEKGGDFNHLRKGIVGDWKNHFSEELYDLFKTRVDKEMESYRIILGE